VAERSLTVLTDVSLITCIVQRGLADTIVAAAREAGAQGATVHFAQGTGVRERLGVLGVAVEVAKEVINVVVGTDQVDRIFEVMYLAGKLDTPGMGFIFITPLEKAGTYIPDEILRNLERNRAKREKDAEQT
jgi:nitrogen regulatory protein PII